MFIPFVPFGVIQADTMDIVILDEQVRSEFPEGISFEISIKSASPIEDIRIFYRSENGGTTSYDNLKFDRGLTVKGYFLLDTSVGGEGGNVTFIPPGAVFRYSFEITDTAGNVLRTQEKEFVYLDSRFQWTHMSKGPITLYYYGPTEKRAETILDAALLTVINMSTVLGVNEIEPINIVAYNNYRHMVAALPPRAQSVREDLVTQGQAFTNIRVLLVLAYDPDSVGIASHEVTHVLVDDSAGKAYSIVPAWLNEGLAEFGNISPGDTYDKALIYGIYTRRVKPLGHLRKFSGNPDDIVIAYGQSSSVVSYLVNTYGVELMAEFMAALERHLSVDDAMMKTYGFDQDGLDSEWRIRMGLRPFPGVNEDSAADGEVAAPSPTTGYPADGVPQDSQSRVNEMKDNQSDSTSPGCNRGVGQTGSISVDLFFMFILAGPIALLPIGGSRKPWI